MKVPNKPEFVEYRFQVWEELKQKQEKLEEKPIKVTVTLGKEKKEIEGINSTNSALDVAGKISDELKRESVVVKVNGTLVDIWAPLGVEDCTLEYFDINSSEGREVFSHSSAHMLGEALELQFGVNLCVGPPLEDGTDHFFYEARMPSPDQQISSKDFKETKKLLGRIVKERQRFEKIRVTKEDALRLMKFNPYKCDILKNKVPDGATCTIYRCGALIDPCRGPHLPNTGYVKGYDVTKVSSSYWKGKAENDVLQRVYGLSFRSKKDLSEFKEKLRLAKQRDHRELGKKQELFFFHTLSPGSCFFLPHGTRIYTKLLALMRSQYWKRGFSEVVTPNIFNANLWKTSGHWQNYSEDMFMFKCEKQDYALKPMNCPGHCLMFKHRSRSYRELPVRFADFGVLHRNELSGTLSGLTRVRRFQQDDAHIFCRLDQISAEFKGCFDFLRAIYGIFGFPFSVELSTRPEKFLGDIEVWNKAEATLKEVLIAGFGDEWVLNPGDGAFYGPKIDIHIKDALGRSFQCATIQLDFQLPMRFGLEYQSEDGAMTTPVIIHRAILGSVERMIAILTEHFGGKWPFWLSPRQCIVVPISTTQFEYAQQVRDQIHGSGFYCDVELSDKKFQKKIRESQLAQYNFILVVGKKEVENISVNVRTRDNEVHGERSVEQLIKEFGEMVANFK